MSADSFHHQVENEIRKKKRLNDFKDFSMCVNMRGKSIEMQPSDFIDYKNDKGTCKDISAPLLTNVSVIKFKKDSTHMFWKESFIDDDFKDTEFFEKR